MTEIARLSKYNPVPAETKAEIIEDALEMVRAGVGLREIAPKLGIAVFTLNQWLLSHPDYSNVCQALTDARLVEARDQYQQDREAMERAQDQFALTRARACHDVSRSEMAYAVLMAERRDSRYQAKPLVQIGINIDIGRALEDAEARAVQYLPKGESNG